MSISQKNLILPTATDPCKPADERECTKSEYDLTASCKSQVMHFWDAYSVYAKKRHSAKSPKSRNFPASSLQVSFKHKLCEVVTNLSLGLGSTLPQTLHHGRL
jgi:hypothetical protein